MARLTRGCRFGRSVADNGYGLFVQVLTTQDAKRGSAVVKSDRFTPRARRARTVAQ